MAPDGTTTVLHIDHSSEPGGAELALARLMVGAENWRPRLALLHDSTGFFAAERTWLSGLPSKPGATAAGPLGAVMYLVSLLRQAWRLRRLDWFSTSDVVHANTTRACVVAALAAVGKKDVKLVMHVRDIVTVETLGAATCFAMRRALRRADGVIANSRATLAAVAEHLPATTARAVVASPIGPHTRPVPYEICDGEPVRICLVARLDPWKGQAALLQACAASLDGLDWRLGLAGEAAFGHGAYADELRGLAADLGVGDRVDFLGHVSDVAALIAASDICVQCSERPEPLGQNVLQYLAGGRPIVAIDAGGPAEWIVDGRSGVLVPMGDVAALGAALRALAVDPEKRRRLADGAMEAGAVLNDEDLCREHGDFLQSVARRGGRS